MKHILSVGVVFFIIQFTFYNCIRGPISVGTDLSNEDMIRYFKENYHYFKLLNDNMLILYSKGLRFVNSYDTDPDLGPINVKEKDIQEIRRQMNSLKLIAVSCNAYKGNVYTRYSMYRRGALGGVSKGFEYLTKELFTYAGLATLYQIDEYLSLGASEKIALDKRYPFAYYIKLDDNWYIFSQNTGP